MADLGRASVRLRTTAAAVLVVAVALLAGSVTLVLLVRGSLRDGVEASAEQRASTLAAQAGSGRLPSAGDDDEDDELIWQIKDKSGKILRSSGPIPSSGYVVATEDTDDYEIVVAASLEDVQSFFRTWYAPNNAVLSVVGDVDTAQVREAAEKYFGGIPPNADFPALRDTSLPPTLGGERRAAGRGHVRLPRGRDDEPGRVLGGIEHGVHVEASRAVPRGRQRLRDLRAGRAADRGRQHLAAPRGLPESEAHRVRRHRPRREPRRGAGRARILPRGEGPGAHPQPRHAPVLALAVRRSSRVSIEARARGDPPRRATARI